MIQHAEPVVEKSGHPTDHAPGRDRRSVDPGVTDGRYPGVLPVYHCHPGDIVDRYLRRERIMSMAGLIGIGVLQALILLLVAPVFSGFSRVLRAKIQTRKGPPLMQNYRDIVKLMKRQEVVSEQAGWVFRVAPYVSMAAMLLVALIVPMLAAASPLGVVGDLILVVYLFAIPRVLFSLAGLDSGSTFGGIGARRELLIAALIEPVLILVVFVLALLVGSTNLGTISHRVATGMMPISLAFWLGMAAFAFATFVEMGKLPFDLAEAEQELQEGPLSEYSGRSLALVKWGLYLKQIVLVALFLSVILPLLAA